MFKCGVVLYLLLLCRKVKVGSQGGSDEKEGNSPSRIEVNGPQRDSKLEFFGFDSLVNILGLKRYSSFYVRSLVFHQLFKISSMCL